MHTLSISPLLTTGAPCVTPNYIHLSTYLCLFVSPHPLPVSYRKSVEMGEMVQGSAGMWEKGNFTSSRLEGHLLIQEIRVNDTGSPLAGKVLTRPLLCSQGGAGPGRVWLLECWEEPRPECGAPSPLTSTLLLLYHLEIWSGLWPGKGTYSFL